MADKVFLDNKDDPFTKDQLRYLSYEFAQSVLVPVRFEGGVSHHTGTSRAPDEIIASSSQLELYDFEMKKEVLFDAGGIHTHRGVVINNGVEKMILDTKNLVLEILKDKKFPILIGGEHTISLGGISACLEYFSGNILVVQLDAHTDLRDVYAGNRYSHACMARRALEMSKKIKFIQFGVRSSSLEEQELVNSSRVKTVSAFELLRDGVQTWCDKLLKGVGKVPVYLTIDSDFFDWEVMRATGTPEPGGVNWYSGLSVIKEIFNNCNVVGADVVELCPDATADKHSQFAAAKLIYKLVGYKHLCLPQYS